MSFTPDREAGTTERTLAALESIAASLAQLADAAIVVGKNDQTTIAVTTHACDQGVEVYGAVTTYPESS